MVEHVEHGGQLMAIIVRREFNEPGVSFFTSESLSHQLAFMHHPDGHDIAAHVHNKVRRDVRYTQEVLILRRGKLRVDFYDADSAYLESRVVRAGDVLLLASGGHGMKVLEEVEMFEVKQGPYSPESDKTVFDAVSDDEVVIEGLHE